ncbi:MAG TPA: hypothetical protein VGS80_12330 [Ktedonobacterales bacterium]|nr:hypothetical protein [Ktedonobacterales bacterium]
MADDYSAVLAHELSAGEGSFLLQLRVQWTWDKAAFTRLTEAMLACCRAYDAHVRRAAGGGYGAAATPLPRWLAEGFGYVSTFVREWTTHPAWAERTAPEQGYYDAAYRRLFMLAEWFFTGNCPYTDPDQGFAPM